MGPPIFIGGNLSKHFWLREFRCKGGSRCCGGTAVVDPNLVTVLEEIRGRFGGAINCVTRMDSKAGSGFRCLVHNARPEIGGVRGSAHTRGQAADIWVHGDYVRLCQACENARKALAVVPPFGGFPRIRLIEYPKQKFVHVEVQY